MTCITMRIFPGNGTNIGTGVVVVAALDGNFPDDVYFGMDFSGKLHRCRNGLEIGENP